MMKEQCHGYSYYLAKLNKQSNRGPSSMHMSLHMSLHMSIHMSLHMSIRMSLHMSVRMSRSVPKAAKLMRN